MYIKIMSDTDEWLKSLEHECEYFDKVPKNIKITFIHLSKSNNIKHIKKDKLCLNEEGILLKSDLIKLLNLQNNKIVGLFKCNTKISINNVKEQKSNFNFCTELKTVKDEKWGETSNFLESLNDLIILIKSRNIKQTKKLKPSHNKTKKNID